MYYLGKWGWGIFYSVTIVGGMGVLIGSLDTAQRDTLIPVGIATYMLSYVASFIHAGVAAANWEDPDAPPSHPVTPYPAPARSFEGGRDPSPAIVIPVLSGRF
jgi:hypothetical protein